MATGRVLVTGASTGIGEATALHLKSLGFSVLAGVRKESDAERARAAGYEPVLLDVTDAEQVRAAGDQAGDVVGLVNNAGVAVNGPLEFLPLDELRRQLEINLIGQLAVTQAMLPALRRNRGRIVNISSIGGRIALPIVGPYAMSKFALEAMSDSLRRELRKHGVNVSVIEPGAIATPIWGKSAAAGETLLAGLPPETDELYGHLIEPLRKEAAKLATTGLPPSAVAEAVGTALTARRPRARYVVGRDAKSRLVAKALLRDRGFDAVLARVLR